MTDREKRLKDALTKAEEEIGQMQEALRPMLPLLVRLEEARYKHPKGPDGLRSLMEEVGEVASAIRKETPERTREELLDVMAVAHRLFCGESTDPYFKKV